MLKPAFYTGCHLFSEKNQKQSIYKFGLSVCLSVCLFVCLYQINVKTAEPIGPKFFVGHLGTPGKVYKSFYDVHKENMFRTNLEDGREAPSKASIYIYIYT